MPMRVNRLSPLLVCMLTFLSFGIAFISDVSILGSSLTEGTAMTWEAKDVKRKVINTFMTLLKSLGHFVGTVF